MSRKNFVGVVLGGDMNSYAVARAFTRHFIKKRSLSVSIRFFRQHTVRLLKAIIMKT